MRITVILLRPAHRVALATCLGGSLLVGACAGSTESTLPFGDAAAPTTFTVANPDVDFGLADEKIITFQGSWVCEFQRRTFAEPSDGEAALDAALIGAGISRDAYDDFLARSAESQDLRSAVLFSYQQSCKP